MTGHYAPIRFCSSMRPCGKLAKSLHVGVYRAEPWRMGVDLLSHVGWREVPIVFFDHHGIDVT